MSYSVVTNYKTTLSSPMTSTQLTVPVNSIQTRDNTPHTIVTADMGDGWYINVAPGTANEEIIEITAVTPSGDGGIFTVPTLGRGLSYYGATDAQGVGNAKPHNPGDIVILTNVKNVYDRLVDKESNETIDGIKTFTDSPLVPVPTTADQATSKGYVDGLIAAGAPDASTTQKGISKISVAPVSPTSPIAVGDNDPRVPTSGQTALLAGITATAVEINVLDGLTTTQAELNQFTGISANVSSTNLNRITAGGTSNADIDHTHANLYGGQDSFQIEASGTFVCAAAGFSDATTKLASYGFAVDTTDALAYKGLAIASDYGSALYTKVVPSKQTVTATAGAEPYGLVIIGTDIWTFDTNGTAGNRIRKNGTLVTISGTGVGAGGGGLGHDPTNGYLLVLDSTTTVKRYSGIAGTTITFVDTITLATAVTLTGFAYDATNLRYICLDTTGNLLRRFSAAGAVVDTAAFTFDDANAVGILLYKGRVHIAVVIRGFLSSSGVTTCQVQYIPTTMTV